MRDEQPPWTAVSVEAFHLAKLTTAIQASTVNT
jgi:hypothetical protein